MKKHGYREFAHTADWGIHVWAEDLTSLLSTAAEGMFSLLEAKANINTNYSLTIKIAWSDSKESLLVDFLNELLYLSERDRLLFVKFDLELSDEFLSGTMIGRRMISQGKEIKAVTFHNLEVITTPDGLETRIVFDV